MRILKVWSCWQDEIKYHDHYLAEEMSEAGHMTDFVAPAFVSPDLVPFLKSTKLTPGKHTFGSSNVFLLKCSLIFGKPYVTDVAYLREILSSNYDVIHIFGISNFIALSVLRIVSSMPKVKVYFNDHNHPDDHKSSPAAIAYHAFFKYMFKYYSGIIRHVYVPNVASRDYLRMRYGSTIEKLTSIAPLGFSSRIYKILPGRRNVSDKLIVGFAGKIYPEKRIEVLLNAVSKLDPDSVELIVVGMSLNSASPYQSSLRDFVQSKCMKNVRLLPFETDSARLAEFYNYIDIAVYPGSISITTLEASGCGTPVILYKSSAGLEDRVDNGRGILFEDDDDLLEALVYYMKVKLNLGLDHDSVHSKSLRFSWATLANSYLDDYRAGMSQDC